MKVASIYAAPTEYCALYQILTGHNFLLASQASYQVDYIITGLPGASPRVPSPPQWGWPQEGAAYPLPLTLTQTLWAGLLHPGLLGSLTLTSLWLVLCIW